MNIKEFLQMVSDKEIVYEDTTIRALQTSLNANVVAIHPGYDIKNELTIKKKTNLLWKKTEIYKEESLTYRSLGYKNKTKCKGKKSNTIYFIKGQKFMFQKPNHFPSTREGCYFTSLLS